MYSHLLSKRLTLLELVLDQLGEVKEEDCVIPLRTAQFLALSFQHSCKAVLALSSVLSADEQVIISSSFTSPFYTEILQYCH